MRIRSLTQSDLPDISRIQRECYSQEMLESVESFSAKLSADSDFCFMAVQDQLAVGYLVALPWVFGEILEHDGLEYAVPPDADSLCIHDLAVSPSARKSGAAKHLLDAVLDTAQRRGYKRVFLVAVQGASSYWKRQGFAVVQVDEALQRRLLSYGKEATYMSWSEGEL